jgi:hypothetical protein
MSFRMKTDTRPSERVLYRLPAVKCIERLASALQAFKQAARLSWPPFCTGLHPSADRERVPHRAFHGGRMHRASCGRGPYVVDTESLTEAELEAKLFTYVGRSEPRARRIDMNLRTRPQLFVRHLHDCGIIQSGCRDTSRVRAFPQLGDLCEYASIIPVDHCARRTPGVAFGCPLNPWA